MCTLCFCIGFFCVYPLKLLDQLAVQVWQALLAVRALVLPPTEDVETWLKFASLCRKSGRISQARSTLVKLLQVSSAFLWADFGVQFATCMMIWSLDSL